MQIKIKNSKQKIEKSFKIILYKNHTNDINIKINNTLKRYYYSEIIFYGEDIEKKIKLNNINYNYNTFNFHKRIRLIICNISEIDLFELIKNNNSDESLNKKIKKIIKNNPAKNLLINIFIGDKNSNILIFKEKNEKLKIPDKEERKLFEEFYNNIMIDDIHEQCSSIKRRIYNKNTLFGIPIINKTNRYKKKIYISFLNQGINCLLENDIITKKDINFMLGYLVFLIYISKPNELDKQKMNHIHYLIEEMSSNFFDEIDQIKIVIMYVILCLNYPYRFKIRFTKDFPKKSPYIEGFRFYENVVKDLNEDSEIMLLFLQLNTGFGFELLNKVDCLKISMISIEEIKNHLVNNIPKYFFVYQILYYQTKELNY